ncbi:MAG: hypothetical protein U0521_01800 [Anaerolineae bacterium]
MGKRFHTVDHAIGAGIRRRRVDRAIDANPREGVEEMDAMLDPDTAALAASQNRWSGGRLSPAA